MKPLIVKYQKASVELSQRPPPKTLVISRLSAEFFQSWKHIIDTGAVDTVIITPMTCTGWRIWVKREVRFVMGIPEDRHDAMCQEQAANRIFQEGQLPGGVQLTSPYCLMQEFVERDMHYPWRVLVACTLLTRTHGRVARPATDALLKQFPTPQALIEGDYAMMEEIIKPLGFKNVRGKRLREMTRDYLDGMPLPELTGVGPYALDSLDLFCWGRTDLAPADQWLKPYLEWRKQGGPAIQWAKKEYLDWWRNLQ